MEPRLADIYYLYLLTLNCMFPLSGTHQLVPSKNYDRSTYGKLPIKNIYELSVNR